MQTIVYNKDTKKILAVIEDVTEITRDSVKGKQMHISGCNMDVLAFVTVDDGTVSIALEETETEKVETYTPDVIDPTWRDKSSAVKSTEQKMQDQIDFLTLQLLEVMGV